MYPDITITLVKCDDKEAVYTYCIDHQDGKETCVVGGKIKVGESITIKSHELKKEL